jgi:hypothetical protein
MVSVIMMVPQDRGDGQGPSTLDNQQYVVIDRLTLALTLTWKTG